MIEDIYKDLRNTIDDIRCDIAKAPKTFQIFIYMMMATLTTILGDFVISGGSVDWRKYLMVPIIYIADVFYYKIAQLKKSDDIIS